MFLLKALVTVHMIVNKYYIYMLQRVQNMEKVHYIEFYDK